MKTQSSFVLLAICAFFVFISAKTSHTPYNYFIKFDDRLFVTRFEVTNNEYQNFLQYLKTSGKTEEFSKCMYDSTQWSKKFPQSFNQPTVDVYHWHPKYQNYPVVNITLEAAKLYCQWLTNNYNDNPKRSSNKVLMRLPTEREWEFFSKPLPGHNLPWFGSFAYEMKENKLMPKANIKVKNVVPASDNYSFDGAVFTNKVGSYQMNNSGLFDIIGNVSEMTNDGKQKGGSWDNYLDECTIEKTQNYILPDPRVGFRVVMEVLEN